MERDSFDGHVSYIIYIYIHICIYTHICVCRKVNGTDQVCFSFMVITYLMGLGLRYNSLYGSANPLVSNHGLGLHNYTLGPI